MPEENDQVQDPEEVPGEADILDRYVPVTNDPEAVEVEGDPAAVPSNRNSQTGVITVICGANTSTFGDISGKSITQLRHDLADVLNIASDAKAIVSGEEVGDDYVLQPGDRVEFIKQAGVKG